MDKATKTQFSLGFFVIGFFMVLAQDLSRLRSIETGFTMPLNILFYLGLILMAIGYYLR
ncbi:MAG TPA: hypothetical protein P5217_02420 [Methanoregulaceae archaeon]|nr:hypothetical protein [Methanoregulaceae archaeon]HPD75233.1 hypothetical protein [Methanoregulaceae archaeon]HRY75116.1 hypothetical protein [Methanoregulaceae archaeon]